MLLVIVIPIVITIITLIALWNPVIKSPRDQQLLFWIKKITTYDLIAVNIIFPCLNGHLDRAGFDADTIRLAFQVFNISQLIGGIAFGILCDHHSSKRDLLITVSACSILAYMLIGMSSTVPMLLMSCCLGGFVKQAFVISSAAIAENTIHSFVSRYEQLGRLYALSLFASIIGEPLGKYLGGIHAVLPLLLAGGLFLLNTFLCFKHLPGAQVHSGDSHKAEDEDKPLAETIKEFKPPTLTVWAAILLKCMVLFAEESMATKNIGTYYSIRFDVGVFFLAFGSIITGSIGIVVYLFFVNPAIHACRSELTLISTCIFVVIFTGIMESLWPSWLSFFFFIFAGMVPNTVAATLISAAATNLYTHAVPREHMGKVLGMLNLFTSLIGTVAPYYGKRVFAFFGGAPNRGFILAGHYVILQCVASVTNILFNMGSVGFDSFSKNKKA